MSEDAATLQRFDTPREAVRDSVASFGAEVLAHREDLDLPGATDSFTDEILDRLRRLRAPSSEYEIPEDICGDTIENTPSGEVVVCVLPDGHDGTHHWSAWWDDPDVVREIRARRAPSSGREPEPTREQLLAAIDLFADDQAFFVREEDGEIVPILLLNDFFAPAADGEVIPWQEVPSLRDKIREKGWPAGVRWAAERRGVEPTDWRGNPAPDAARPDDEGGS